MDKERIKKIFNKEIEPSKEDLSFLMKYAPYAQHLQKIAEDKQENNILNLLNYDIQPEEHIAEDWGDDVVNIDILKLKSKEELKKKKRSKKKAASPDKKPKNLANEADANKKSSKKEPLAIEPETTELAIPEDIKEKTADPGKSDKEIINVDLDDFTKWLNSLADGSDAESHSGKESKKKRKKKKKDKIKEKIDESVKMKEEIVTEALAKLYEKQEYYEKAIEVYETLRLKIPEKSGLFAARIEKLKDKI